MDTAAIPSTPPPPPARREAMLATARQLEAAFLAEMLSHAGLGALQGGFGGAEGEAQFASFLRQEQAAQMVGGGGIGLAQMIFDSMARAEPGVDHARDA